MTDHAYYFIYPVDLALTFDLLTSFSVSEIHRARNPNLESPTAYLKRDVR